MKSWGRFSFKEIENMYIFLGRVDILFRLCRYFIYFSPAIGLNEARTDRSGVTYECRIITIISIRSNRENQFSMPEKFSLGLL